VTAADRVIRWTTAVAVIGVAAVALVGSYELPMMIIRAAQLPGTGAALGGAPECMPATGPLQVRPRIPLRHLASHACDPRAGSARAWRAGGAPLKP
jgi:hypothetical protein